MVGHEPKSVIKSRYANAWLLDAVAEAQIDPSRDARRREILFATCFTESYLVEWIQDDLLIGRAEDLSKYLPAGQKYGVKKKWKVIPPQLKSDALIKDTPNLGASFWSEFCELVALRDGLVHARSSRPFMADQPQDEQPKPGVDELSETIGAGWAVSTVVELVRKFHESAETEVPKWVEKAASP